MLFKNGVVFASWGCLFIAQASSQSTTRTGKRPRETSNTDLLRSNNYRETYFDNFPRLGVFNPVETTNNGGPGDQMEHRDDPDVPDDLTRGSIVVDHLVELNQPQRYASQYLDPNSDLYRALLAENNLNQRQIDLRRAIVEFFNGRDNLAGITGSTRRPGEGTSRSPAQINTDTDNDFVDGMDINIIKSVTLRGNINNTPPERFTKLARSASYMQLIRPRYEQVARNLQTRFGFNEAFTRWLLREFRAALWKMITYDSKKQCFPGRKLKRTVSLEKREDKCWKDVMMNEGNGAYTALGDSTSSSIGGKVGARGQSCRQYFGEAFPSLVNEAVNSTDFDFLACAKDTTMAQVRDEQIQKMVPDSSLVTITVGAGDAGISRILDLCTSGRRCPRRAGRIIPAVGLCCETELGKANNVVNGMTSELKRTFDDVVDRAQNGNILAIGYPELFAEDVPTSRRCRVDQDIRRDINSLIRNLNGRIQQASSQAGIRFANPNSAFDTHRICDGVRNGRSEWISSPPRLGPRSQAAEEAGKRLEARQRDTGLPSPNDLLGRPFDFLPTVDGARAYNKAILDVLNTIDRAAPEEIQLDLDQDGNVPDNNGEGTLNNPTCSGSRCPKNADSGNGSGGSDPAAGGDPNDPCKHSDGTGSENSGCTSFLGSTSTGTANGSAKRTASPADY